MDSYDLFGLERGKYMKRKKIKKQTIIGLIFLFPAAAFILIFMIIPLIWNFGLSFFEWNGNSAVQFKGFDNFVTLLTTKAVTSSITKSIFIALVATVVAMGLGIVYALFLYRLRRREQKIFRFIFFSPAMLPLSVVGVLFIFVFANDSGILNSLLEAIGLGSLRRAWLGEPQLSLWVIAIVQGWRQSGVVMILTTTAILGLPKSLFENGILEGTTYWEDVKYIILPLIKSSVNLLLSMMLMSGFKTYDMVYAMTKGGPGEMTYTVPMKIIQLGFSYNRYGEAAALGTILTVIATVLILLSRYSMRGETYEY